MTSSGFWLSLANPPTQLATDALRATGFYFYVHSGIRKALSGPRVAIGSIFTHSVGGGLVRGLELDLTPFHERFIVHQVKVH